jgi:hypothetical protein
MRSESKIALLRIACWLIIVVLPTIAICWYADLLSVAAFGVALPFILIAERVFRASLQKLGLAN